MKNKKEPLFKEFIQIRGASEHNLKNIDVDIPIDKLTVITGLSGSGKSTLAFDTLYAEGQRRYVESLSSYARQFLGIMNKPKVDKISGLSPAISIEQKTVSHNPRSTVGTITEIYDYLRLLFARIGEPHCPLCGQKIIPQDAETISKNLIRLNRGQEIKILAPVVRGKKGNFAKLFEDWQQQGFVKIYLDKEEADLQDYVGKGKKTLVRFAPHEISLVVDELKVSDKEQPRLLESLELALKMANGLVLIILPKVLANQSIGKQTYEEKLYSRHLACPDCNLSLEELEPRLFSFNSPFGACPTCAGLGFVQKFDPSLVIPNKDLRVYEGAILPWRTQVYGWKGRLLEEVAKQINLNLEDPIKHWEKNQLDVILYGLPDKKMRFKVKDLDSGNSYNLRYEGVINELERHYKQTLSDSRKREIEQYIRHLPCPACQGARLKPESLAVLVNDKNIFEVSGLSVDTCLQFFSQITLNESQTKIAQEILKEIKSRLRFLQNVGLQYLSLSRQSGTLSGGEAQRIRLATQIGSELRGVLYILDEPSIGLHQRDNDKLITTLKNLRDLKNTVIVVEHDEATIRSADYVVDIGPGAGIAGGEVVACGIPADIIKNKKSLTGAYMSGRQKISLPARRLRPQGFIKLTGASQNNLKQIDVDFPIGVFTCVTGVSGSGKSTLVNETLYRILAKKINKAKDEPGQYKQIDNLGFIDKVIIIDQSPIGRTPRSNPATYTKVFTDIRELFSMTKEAKIRGYRPGRFSFNVDEGRCGHCEGDGVIKIEMNFLSDVYITCEQCKGRRYNQETLQVLYKGKNIADILDMPVQEALPFFALIPKIASKLQTLYDVGLGYIKLGQSATTLSGGEAQRVKLATELAKRDTGRTFYILDEPTTGLHFADVKNLLQILHRLVEKGNSVLVIEHNLDVIKNADYIIDLGPEGGEKGGEVVAKGTPEQVVQNKFSATGQFLKSLLLN